MLTGFATSRRFVSDVEKESKEFQILEAGVANLLHGFHVFFNGLTLRHTLACSKFNVMEHIVTNVVVAANLRNVVRSIILNYAYAPKLA